MKRPAIFFLVLGLFSSAQLAQADWNPTKRLTWTSGASMNPAMAIDSSDTSHIVWDDNTPGNNEIYYKKYIK